MNPSASPAATSRIGYGIRSVGASAISAATAASRPSRTSSPWVLKAIALEYEPVCGICGIASTGAPVDPGRLAEMSATLVHRGPDSDGVFLDGGVGLAARRLSIIDLESGDQPIANEDGTVHVVQNGEIYNHKELRVELERAGHRFRTRC